MAWLDTAWFFDVRSAVDLAGRDLEMSDVLRNDVPLATRSRDDSRIAAALIVQDEQDRLARALSSVMGVVDEVVVVDGGSRDNTRTIARDLGAVVIERPFDGDFSTQRNFGIRYVSAPWVLIIDADEVVTPELGAVLLRIAASRWADAAFVHRLTLVEGEDEPKWWPDMTLRLFRRDVGRYVNRLHERVVGWSRPIYAPASGPYLLHETTQLRTYRRSLYYASLDPQAYSEEWLAHARVVVRMLEEAATDNDDE